MLALHLDAAAGPASIPLGSAADFRVLAGVTVTSTGDTTVLGDLGVSPGTAIVGFPPGRVFGTIHAADAVAAQAQVDLTLAYNDALARTQNIVAVAGEIGGQILTQGLYKAASSLALSTGDLTLDARGDTHAVWIFQIGSTLTVGSGRQVILTGGARAAQVFWQVGSSATLGTGCDFRGTIMADQSITLQTGAMLDGRALARHAAVTLDANGIGSTATVVLVSAPVVAGPYEDAPGQILDPATQTITVPPSGDRQFYAIRADAVRVIVEMRREGLLLAITYQ